MNLQPFESTEPISVVTLNKIINDYKDMFLEALDVTNCGKWGKWLKDPSIHLFPCCCHTRELPCVFIEAYFEAYKALDMHDKEDSFKSLVLHYKKIKEDKNAVGLWHVTHSKLAFDTNFKSEIKIMLELDPYKVSKIKLIKDEFKYVLKFQRIIRKLDRERR